MCACVFSLNQTQSTRVNTVGKLCVCLHLTKFSPFLCTLLANCVFSYYQYSVLTLVHISGKLDYKFLYKENLLLESFLLMRLLGSTVFTHFALSKAHVPHWWCCMLHAQIQANIMAKVAVLHCSLIEMAFVNRRPFFQFRHPKLSRLC